MKYIFLIGVFLSLNLSLSAQHKCGTTERHLHRIQEDPSVLQRKEDLNQRIQTYLANNAQRPESQAVITIPVVVHIVYPSATSGAAVNISDAQIQSQITALNKDYSKTNSDIGSVPTIWAGLAANVQIQFCLAKRDPSGAATTGITRKTTSRSSFTDVSSRPDGMDEIKLSTYGKPSWDRTKYLNIWVGKLDGQTLGFAYFPSDIPTNPELDGVVIDYRAFGTTGTAGTGPFTGNALGRTLTHELGHYFNLSHTWGDDIDPVPANCESDFVDDTPPSQDANYGCPIFPFHVGGACTVGTNGEMPMNYMDYPDDACMYLFTTGQGQRMTTCINVERTSLLTSNGCSTPINVEMVYFKGDNQLKINRLYWQTASESKNDYFEIERSTDGKNFKVIGRVKGHGSTASVNNYEWQDPSVSAGSVAYYRLRQVDFDGTFAYSNVVALTSKANSKVKIFPNPVVHADLTVQFEDNSRKTVSLTDALGRLIFSQTVADFELKVPTLGLSAGVYFCRVQLANGAIEVKKVVLKD